MSAFSTFRQEDFPPAVAHFLPRGRAWPRDADTVLSRLLGAIGDGFWSLHARAVILLEREADPAFTQELLPDWESDYGLPDPCTPAGSTIVQRHAALLAKIAGQGGQSIAYYVSVAAALGYTITITEFRPFLLGWSHLGDLLCGPGWQFVWQVNAPQITVHRFTLGVSVMPEPFWTVDNTELECRLRQIMPAHTILNFVFS